MKEFYKYEPTKGEVFLAELVGYTALHSYYKSFVNELEIHGSEDIIDYCCGNGNISKFLAKRITTGSLIFADVSEKWLNQTAQKLKHCPYSQRFFIKDFGSKIGNSESDIIVLHYSLHDFPKDLWIPIINQLINNLKIGGTLYIREPLSENHGLKLYELTNILESTKKIAYKYSIRKKNLLGHYIDVKCTRMI